jgi:hypothetical protein
MRAALRFIMQLDCRSSVDVAGGAGWLRLAACLSLDVTSAWKREQPHAPRFATVFFPTAASLPQANFQTVALTAPAP